MSRESATHADHDSLDLNTVDHDNLDHHDSVNKDHTHHDSVVPPRDEAIVLLWDRYHSGLVRLAAGLLPEMGAGEEIVQEAFAALLRRWRQLRDPSAAHAYLRRVAVNEVRR
jgi:DNA-directed RNA polymerase specialized sigma24 family protein